MKITEFSLKDVRCFAGEHRLRIRPLTFLIGENSTGKSTVLACMQSLADFHQYGMRQPGFTAPDFNQPPYQLGSFQDIVRKSRPLNTYFELGFEVQFPKESAFQYRVVLHEREEATEPVIGRQEWDFPDGKIALEPLQYSGQGIGGGYRQIEVNKKLEKGKPVFTVQAFSPSISTLNNLVHWTTGISGALEKREQRELLDFLQKRLPARTLAWPGYIRSMAPLRSEPQRTYDPIAGLPYSSGANIPMYLMNLARNDKQAWESLREELIDFGQESGLFKDIRIRQLGKSGSNPFQLQVKAHGPRVNLIDSGYGTSQILPILVNSIQLYDEALLLQQPEVHLHPRAQAALTTLLVKRLAGKGKSRRKALSGCVIETHSDYMIDRARIEIMQGNIAADDVALAYLEKRAVQGVRIHNITFDKMGNMENVPANYRQFFLKETDRLLGFDLDK